MKLNRPVLISVALPLAAVLAFLAGAVRVLLSGKLIAAWQVTMLGLNVLGEVASQPISNRTLSSRGSTSKDD